MAEPTRLSRQIEGVGLLEFVESDKRRDYWLTREGAQRRQRVPSVTTILRETWPKPQLLEWYAKHGENTKTVLGVASARGKSVHAFIEDYLRTGTPPSLSDYEPELRPYIQGAAAFLWDYDPEPEAQELLVVHPELFYAGRYDLRAKLNGKSVLLDFKTNSHGRVYAEAHVQAHAYAIADERCGADPVDGKLLVGIGQDGNYNVVQGVECADLWSNALAFHKSIKKVENALEKAVAA